MVLVLDASVAAKWVLPSENEQLVDQALRLFERYSDDQLQFVVPDLFWPEFGNIVWKAVRQGRISASSAAVAIAEMHGREFSTIPSKVLLDDAFIIANAFGRSVYEAMYVALAVARNTEFVTADERLASALAARLPVKWLGAI